MKQTAVEWLEAHLIEYGFDLSNHKLEINQAKEMEKEQIIESYCVGCAEITKDNSIFPRETSEQYYIETFKSE
jgi:hypothetical protein